jgi:hypothetical protein
VQNIIDNDNTIESRVKQAMLNKGNVLQYKANSMNLTKMQRYSKIAKGQWVNRNTTWATQSETYSNPNTTHLKRNGNSNIAIDPILGTVIGPTLAPITCPNEDGENNNNNSTLPDNQGQTPGTTDPSIPPSIPPTSGSDTFPVIIPDTPVLPIVIPDGGSLLCSVQENICTGNTIQRLSQQLCHLTTDSDVPGTIQDLCWNDGTPTWYPRQRYIMTNSTNKWPVNAILVSSIMINPPVIISASSSSSSTSSSSTSSSSVVTLQWTFDASCLPASSFLIFQNGLFVSIVNNLTFSVQLNQNPNQSQSSYYLVAINATSKSISKPSNVVYE